MPKQKKKVPRNAGKKGNKGTKLSTAVNKPAFSMSAHVMFDATINTGVSYTRQINISPYLGLFPTALEQSKYYQLYRIPYINVRVTPLHNVNTQTATNITTLCEMYAVPLENDSIPGANAAAYLMYNSLKYR